MESEDQNDEAPDEIHENQLQPQLEAPASPTMNQGNQQFKSSIQLQKKVNDEALLSYQPSQPASANFRASQNGSRVKSAKIEKTT